MCTPAILCAEPTATVADQTLFVNMLANTCTFKGACIIYYKHVSDVLAFGYM